MDAHALVPEARGCGLVVWNLEGTIVRANATFWSLLGRVATDPSSYWQLTASGQHQREVNLLLAGEGAFEKEFLHAAGHPITARVVGGVLGEGDARLFFAYVDGGTRANSDRERMERTLRHQNAILLDLTKADALDAGDINEAVALVTAAGANGLHCARSSVWLFSDDETKIHCLDLFEREKATHTKGSELTSKDFPRYFEALREDRTIAANDAHSHPATSEFSSVYLTPLGITSMLEAPIRSRGRLVGVLCSEHVGDKRDFSQEEQNFAASVADAFGRSLQAAERRRYETALKESNERLESTVRARTASLQTALDSMGDGLLVCERSGIPTGDRSRAVEEWFGPLSAGVPVWDYVTDGVGPVRSGLSLLFSAIDEGYLPFPLLEDQAPRRLERGGRTFALSYRAIAGASEVERVVLLIRDITVELAAERSEARGRELAAIVGHLVRDRDAFVSFVEEVESLLQRLASPAMPHAVRLRALHTLKGNTAFFGFGSFSSECHALEDRVRLATEDGFAPQRIAALDARWRAAMDPLSGLLSPDGSSSVRLLDSEYSDFIERLQRRTNHAELIELAQRWKQELVGSLLASYATEGVRLAASLGKKVAVHIDDHGERLPDPAFRPFFSELIHCVRNALDHGLETPEERTANDKTEEGTLRLDVRRVAEELVVTISDDGRGIDWNRVRAKAEACGLPRESNDDLVEALLSDGFSTQIEATELSGRGLGLGAVAASCRALGGRVHVESRRNAGTRIVFRLPTIAFVRPSKAA